MNITLVRFVSIIALISLLCLFAFGQATTGSVSVTVWDQTGTRIPGATATISPKDLTAGGSFEGMADDSGTIDFLNLPPGDYVLKTSVQSFRSNSKKIIVFSGYTQIVDISLDVGTSSDTVVVISDQNTRPDNVVKSESDKDLPATPSFGSLLDTSPYVRDEPLAAGISIDGSTKPDNTYFIDGQEVTNPHSGVFNQNFNLPWTLVQEVGVRSGAETAQYGGSIGGVVNVVTRGGNNDWHGDFGFSFTPRGLNGGTRPLLTRFGVSNGQFEYFQPNKDDSTGYFPYGSMSGPLVQNRLWFFGSYSPQIYSNRRTIDYFNSSAPSRTITQSIDYEQNVRNEFAFIRLDARPLRTIQASGKYLWNPTIQDGALPGLAEGLNGNPQFGNGLNGAAFLATRGGRNNSNFVTGDVTWTPNSFFFVGFRGGYNFLNEKLDSYGTKGGTRYLCSVTGTPENVPGSNCSRGFDTGDNFVNSLSATARKNIGVDGGITGINNFGRHQIRFGYQYDRVERRVNQGYPDTGLINLYYNRPITNFTGLPATPGNLGSGFLQRFGTIGDVKGSNQAIYAQDSVLLGDRVAFNFGIRLENEDIPDYGYSEMVDFGWRDKISPRVGITVDAFGNGKTLIYGGYYWNYDRMKLSFFEELGGFVLFRDYFEILPSRGAAFNAYTLSNILGNDPNPNVGQCPISSPFGYSVCRLDFTVPAPQLPGFTVPVIDPDLRPTKQKTLIFGAEQEIAAGFTIRGRYIRKELDNIIEDVGFFNALGSEAYGLGNVDRGIFCNSSLDANIPCGKAERRFDGVSVGFDKRAYEYFFNARYTWSRLVGSYSGLASSDEFGDVAPNGTRSFDLPSGGFTANGVMDNGKLPMDRPHELKGYGGYMFRWGANQQTSVSGFTTVRSGTPLTTYYNLYNFATSILFGRGDLGRTEKFTETDLRVGHKFGVGRDQKYQIELFSVFLNLFDERNELSRQTLISSTNFTSAALMAGGCTTCQNQLQVYNTIFNAGGIQQFVQNYLNARGTSGTGFRNDYNLPDRFQFPRSVRFGVNVRF